ncbi:MAG: hypothetical protein CSA35_00065 [Dethiosulfovibrio peptidovorans]|nr:MAG: hypothetical protein CSA35_00065 [Dethiosulfovibrio peptidovorans]
MTTSIVGNCGLSMAPLSEEYREEARQYQKAFLPKNNEYPWDWSSLSEFWSYALENGMRHNLAPLVGQGSIRIAVKGFDPSPATKEEMDEMKSLLQKEIRAGAFGLSSGLIYPPGSYTSTDELLELSTVLREEGGIYASHLRSEGDRLVEATKEAILIGEKNRIPVELSHHKAVCRNNWGKVNETLRLMEEARTAGVDVACDVYPYPAAMTTVTSLLPSEALSGGISSMLQRLGDPEARVKIQESISSGTMKEENWILGIGWEKIVIAECGAAARYEGMSLEEIIAERDPKSPYASFFDWMLEVKGEATMITFGMDETDVQTVLQHRLSSVISDSWVTAPRAGGHPHPRGYGSFPRFLGRYVRDKKMMPLEEGVRKMTSLPANRMRIYDRGILRPGVFADIVIFDREKIIDRATFSEPHQYPEGIRYVMVNGKVVVKGNTLTGKRPGRVLKNNFKIWLNERGGWKNGTA